MMNRILLVSLPAVLMASSAIAAPSSKIEAVLGSEPAVSDSELADMRAGFFTAGGAQFDFGASIKTMVNGEMALQTNLQWTQAGAVTRQLTGLGHAIASQVSNQVASNLASAGIPAASSVTAAVATAANAASDAVQTPSAPQTADTPPAANVPSSPSPESGAAPAVAGVEVPGIGGSTQVLANLSPNQIQNIILNTASGQSITQDTNITFTIYNFQAWQQQLAARAVSARLAGDMLAAAGFAAGH